MTFSVEPIFLVAATAVAVALAVAVPAGSNRGTLRARRTIAHSQSVGMAVEGAQPALGQRVADFVRARWKPASAARARRAAGLEFVTSLAAELRAGQPVRTALERAAAATPQPVCPRAVGVVGLGGDVPRALQRDAVENELPILHALGALWRVAEGSGAGLAEAADRLAKAEADNEDVRRELVAQLAGPKATARVLACLPIFGLVLGSVLGASPISWLLESTWGMLICIAGVSLEIGGIWWTARLTRSVETLL